MGAIGWTQPDGQVLFKCGGSLIWDNFVLTAAHCAVDDANQEPDVVRFGDLNIFSSEGDEDAQQIGIAEIIRHPEHRFSANYHDIALLRLERNVMITKAVIPACLWPNMEVRFKRMDAVGWGSVGFSNQQSPELLKMTLSPIPNSECEKVFNKETNRKLRNGLQSQHICAIDKKADTCEGDSGGPLQVKLVHNIRETPFIVGVTSFGLPCSPSSPGVYTRVASYMSWIISMMRSRGAAVDDQTFNTTVCAHRHVELRDYYEAIVMTRNGANSEIDWFQQHISPGPYMVSFVAKLGWAGPESRDDCFGIILDEDTVLTVAECAEYGGYDGWQKVTRIVHPELIDVSSICIHPEYVKGSPYNNIAILKLKSLLSNREGKLATACIWHSYQIPLPQITSTGFGRTDLVEPLYNSGSWELDPTITNLTTKITIQNETTCTLPESSRSQLRHTIAHEHVCAGNDFFLVPETCHMPLGLPLFTWLDIGERYYTFVYALAQNSRDCGFGEHFLATRLASHVEWMKSILLPNYQDIRVTLQFLDTDQNVGDSCQLGTGYEGSCVPLTECFSSTEDFNNHKNIRLCSSTNIVCCPLRMIHQNQRNNRHAELKNCPALVRQLKPSHPKGYLVQLGWNIQGSYSYRCLGSIITSQIVVTTASCLTPTIPNVIRHLATTQLFPISSFKIHESFNPTDGAFDIALLKIKDPFTWTHQLYPTCLYTNQTHTPLVMRKTYLTANGTEEDFILPKYNSDCQRVHPTQLQRSQLCGRGPEDGQAVCGNSSDMLNWNDEDGVGYLVGMALREEQCSARDYGIFTRISPLVEWIERALVEADGGGMVNP